MSSADEVGLMLLPVATAGSLWLLRRRFPHASRRSQTVVLAAATLVYFSICNLMGAAG